MPAWQRRLDKITHSHVQARGSQQRYSERHREASTALQAAKDRADAAQDQVKYLKDTIADQDGKLHRLEQQVHGFEQVRDVSCFLRKSACGTPATTLI